MRRPSPFTCVVCECQPRRSVATIVKELRDALPACLMVAGLEHPRNTRLFQVVKAALHAQRFIRGLCDELEGKCLRCAHPWSSLKRWDEFTLSQREAEVSNG
jgi:hypothetical protein